MIVLGTLVDDGSGGSWLIVVEPMGQCEPWPGYIVLRQEVPTSWLVGPRRGCWLSFVHLGHYQAMLVDITTACSPANLNQ